MDKKIAAVVLIVFFCLVALAASVTFKSTTQLNISNSTQNNLSNTSNVKVSGVRVVATQTGPSTARKGENVTIKYNVTNKGGASAYNVKAQSQNFDKNLGTLKAGETRNFQYTMHIPTDQEVQEDFGANSTVSNPFFIGGFSVSYTDSAGSSYSLSSNDLEIKLV